MYNSLLKNVAILASAHGFERSDVKHRVQIHDSAGQVRVQLVQS